MNSKITSLIVIIGIALIAGCVQQVSQNEIQFIDMNKELICVGSFELKNKEFIINLDEEYKKLLSPVPLYPTCENFVLPSINFSQYTLLGKYTQSGGCSVNFIRNVYRDESNKKITYSIRVVKEGTCEKLVASMNWILIPKVPSDYNLEFQIK